MKQLIITLIFLLQVSLLFAQQEKKDIRKGNELYNQKRYKEAQASYLQAVKKKQKSAEANFNLADAMYKQKQYDAANKLFNKIGSQVKNTGVAASAWHNQGNSLMEQKKYEDAITSYKKSLLNNPNDEQTRYNLAYAQEKLKNQNKNDKNKNKNDKNKDKNKDKDKDKDKNKNDKNKDNKNDKDKDKKDQDKNNQDKNNQDKQNQNQQPKPQLSKEDAQRMLDALNNNEQQTQDKLKNEKLKGQKVRVAKDW